MFSRKNLFFIGLEEYSECFWRLFGPMPMGAKVFRDIICFPGLPLFFLAFRYQFMLTPIHSWEIYYPLFTFHWIQNLFATKNNKLVVLNMVLFSEYLAMSFDHILSIGQYPIDEFKCRYSLSFSFSRHSGSFVWSFCWNKQWHLYKRT